MGSIKLQHLQNPAGEGSCCFEGEHALFISLAPRPIEYLQIQDGKTHTGLYKRGEILITPANTPLFVRWSGNENCLQIRLTTEYMHSIARETLNRAPDPLELLPEFQIRNPQIEACAMMLLAEHQQEYFDSGLYLDSLTNVLIKLTDLAQLLDMSQFHFSRLFKQSIGITPHQYLSQQRVERAKQLLKKTDHSIADIAFECGFSSHSHLSKQFRQFTGVTPKAYRLL